MTKSKSKKSGKKPAQVQPKTSQSKVVDEEADPFDFGGLPQRDLKKNLGCG